MHPETPLTIVVQYSCDLCGLKRVPVVVPARLHEEVMVWMDMVIRHVSADHALKRPNCHPEKLTDLLIPLTGVTKVGGPPVS